MKTIATTMMAQVIATLTVSDIIYALLPSLVMVLIGIVFAVDLYNYVNLLDKRIELAAILSVMEDLTYMEKKLNKKVSRDREETIKEVRKMLDYVNYKIENYKGLSKPILGLFGIR